MLSANWQPFCLSLNMLMIFFQIGVELGKKLSQVEGSLTISASPPTEGMFISSAGALLAAMVICADQIQQEKQWVLWFNAVISHDEFSLKYSPRPPHSLHMK